MSDTAFVCPHCGAPVSAAASTAEPVRCDAPTPSRPGVLTYVAIVLAAIVVGILALAFVLPSDEAHVRDVVDANRVQSQVESAFIDKGFEAAIYEIQSDEHGNVTITLSMTTDSLGGKAYAYDVASGAASTAFSASPEVSRVSVEDSDKRLIDFYSRP